MRTIEYYDNNYDEWFDVNWSDVVSGTVVRIYEEDGTPVPDGTGIFELKVLTDAYQQTVTSGGGLIWHIDIADPDPPFPVPRREE
jgi:hypothetical protein